MKSLQVRKPMGRFMELGGAENAATLQDTALEQEVSNKNNKHL